MFFYYLYKSFHFNNLKWICEGQTVERQPVVYETDLNLEHGQCGDRLVDMRGCR